MLQLHTTLMVSLHWGCTLGQPVRQASVLVYEGSVCHPKGERERSMVLFKPINFYRVMLCISAVYAGMRCLSVTFVSCAKTNKDIFKFFSPSGSQAILVFPYERVGAIPTGTPLTGASNARGMTIFYQYLALSQKRL